MNEKTKPRETADHYKPRRKTPPESPVLEVSIFETDPSNRQIANHGKEIGQIRRNEAHWAQKSNLYTEDFGIRQVDTRPVELSRKSSKNVAVASVLE